jgi:PAS domain S-box-containing protein
MQGDVQFVINIIKMRGSEHSKNLRMYNITDKGLVVGKSLEGYEGVTTGVSKKIAELEKEGLELKEVIKQKEMAEKVLRESEEKFRLLFNDSPLGIALVDPEGIIKEVNSSLLQLLSIRKEEFIGKNFVQLISVYGLDVQEQTSDFKNRIAGKPSKSEITFLSKDNKKATMTVQSSIIKSNDVIIGVLFILEDITERKRVEGMLSETNQYLENLFNYANAPIIVWDAQFAITRFNHAFESLTGRSVKDVIGKTLEILFPPDLVESSMELIRKTREGKQWEVVEIDVLHLDGSRRTVLWNSANLFAPDSKTLIATIAQGQDITKRKRALDELKVANEKLNQIKSDFFEVTTREIRSPLTTIKGYMEMLSNRTFGEINDEQKKYLDIMLRNTNQLDNLVSDLVGISSIESGDMTFTLKKTSISKMVNEAVEKIQSSADVKNIAVNVEIEDQIPDLIVDQDRIKQVLIDILGYTIKFSPDKTTVNMRAKKQETDVLFEIQDQGLNIPKDKQKKIFKAFYRAEEGKSKEYLGGGIRLALSRGIITIHGGKMWVESEDEKGSTFRFTLPIKPVDNIQTRYKESDIFESKKDDENIEIN